MLVRGEVKSEPFGPEETTEHRFRRGRYMHDDQRIDAIPEFRIHVERKHLTPEFQVPFEKYGDPPLFGIKFSHEPPQLTRVAARARNSRRIQALSGWPPCTHGTPQVHILFQILEKRNHQSTRRVCVCAADTDWPHQANILGITS